MRVFLGVVFFFISGAFGIPASNVATGPHIEVSLLSEYAEVKPGSEHWIGIYLQPDPQWHTYWLNPGDSGEPPRAEWQFSLSETGQSEGVIEAGSMRWPVAKAIPVAHLVNYGYEADTLLMLPVKVSDKVTPGQELTITADVSWLVCKEDCIPGWATLTLSLPVVSDYSEDKQDTHRAIAKLFENTRESWPDSETLTGVFEITEEHIIVSIEALPDGQPWRVLPFRGDVIQHADSQRLNLIEDTSSFVIAKSDYFSGDPEFLQFLVTDGQSGYYLDASLNKQSSAGHNDSVGFSVLMMMLFAFAGGVILNLMPCVMPVLALKALSIGEQSVSVVVKMGYMFGVLLSFLCFAIIIEVFKAAGEAVGWGFHMQEPGVIILLCFLFLYLALILLDAAPGGQRLMGLGQNLTQGSGFGSQFFTGVLAVTVASPCTAPFMGVALGAAMVSSAASSILIFLSLGLGFALPLTLIFFNKKLMQWIPKSGPWMETFKQFLAFPMFATVIWLLWVFLGQTGSFAQAMLMLSLLLFALTLWSVTRVKKFVLAILGAITIVSVAMTFQLEPAANGNLANNSTSNTGSVNEGRSWSPALMQRLKSDNQVVLVNMTADWCITCKVNEQVAFNSDEFNRLLANKNVHYLVGDWTNKNEEILRYLNQYERAGVPLYVIYAGTQYEAVLPQILTPQILNSAIQEAMEKI